MTAPPAGRAAAGVALPPATQLVVGALALVIVGGVYIAAQLPGRPVLAPAIGLAAAAGALLLVTGVLLSRVRTFAWRTFRRVGAATLGAYVVIAGMLEFVFVYDGTPGATLAVLSAMLALFAVAVPLLMAFTVARYQPPD